MTDISGSDGDLWRSWCEGDQDAGRVLVARHFGAVSRFFANKVSGDHDDLIQETFAACIEGRARVREPDRFRSYLFGIAYNVLRKHYGRRHGIGDVEQLESQSVHDLAPGPSTLLRADEQQRLLAEALRKIPLGLQVAVELSYWEGMKSSEIAHILGVPGATVRTRLRRARQLLAETLEQQPAPNGLRERTNEGLDAWAMRVFDANPEPSSVSPEN